MTTPELIRLRRDDLALRLCPELGGAIHDLTWRDQPVLRPPMPDALARRSVRGLGCFPLLPYSNRIANGRFSWRGEHFQLDHNFPDHPHSMHGVGWQQPWRVISSDDVEARIAIDYDPDETGLYTWPFAFSATLTVALDGDGALLTLDLRNTDARAWPAGLGFHPHFPTTPDLTLGFAADAVWTADPLSLPLASVPIPPAWRFDPPIHPPAPLDNCFAGWNGAARLRWPDRDLSVGIEADARFRHLMVYAPERAGYCAVEPATHLPDAINRDGEHGLVVIAPGESLTGWMRLRAGPA